MDSSFKEPPIHVEWIIDGNFTLAWPIVIDAADRAAYEKAMPWIFDRQGKMHGSGYFSPSALVAYKDTSYLAEPMSDSSFPPLAFSIFLTQHCPAIKDFELSYPDKNDGSYKSTKAFDGAPGETWITLTMVDGSLSRISMSYVVDCAKNDFLMYAYDNCAKDLMLMFLDIKKECEIRFKSEMREFSLASIEGGVMRTLLKSVPRTFLR